MKADGIRGWLRSGNPRKYDLGRVLMVATLLYFGFVTLMAVYMRFDTASDTAARQSFDSALKEALDKAVANAHRSPR